MNLFMIITAIVAILYVSSAIKHETKKFEKKTIEDVLPEGVFKGK